MGQTASTQAFVAAPAAAHFQCVRRKEWEYMFYLTGFFVAVSGIVGLLVPVSERACAARLPFACRCNKQHTAHSLFSF